MTSDQTPSGTPLFSGNSSSSYIMVASTGGHLSELVALSKRVAPTSVGVQWVTFKATQTDSLLAGEAVNVIPKIVGRTNPIGLVNLLLTASRLIRSHPSADVVSTGAAIAVPFMIAARLMGRRAHYIESSARYDGPSITGRIVQRIPGVHLYTQHRRWENDRWHYQGSVLDGFKRGPNVSRPPDVRKVVVTIGMNSKPFTALVERLMEIIPSSVEVLWQLGYTPPPRGLEGSRSMVPTAELLEAVAGADLVIAHAGMGSSMDALGAGHIPVLVPRSFDRGEHLDDHQQELAALLSSTGLATCLQLEDLTWEALQSAALRRCVRTDQPRPFRLRH